MKHPHSTHHQFDDPRYWQFSRQSGLPPGYFDRAGIADIWVVVLCVVCLLIGLGVTL